LALCEDGVVRDNTTHTPNNTMSKLKTKNYRNTLHSYAVEVERGVEIDVEAVNRTQAAAIVRKMGHTVRSVNFLG